jgi:hypothetical protein
MHFMPHQYVSIFLQRPPPLSPPPSSAVALLRRTGTRGGEVLGAGFEVFGGTFGLVEVKTWVHG